MKTSPPLPKHLRFEAVSLPVIAVKNLPHGRLKRVRTGGDCEFVSDLRGRYAYDLAIDFAYLNQWRIGADGILHPLSPLRVAAHSHPNTLQYHPNGRFAYVTCSHGAICQYHIRSGALIEMKPREVYTNNNPSLVWFDRTGNFASVITPGAPDQYPPNDRVYVYRVRNDGRLDRAHLIEVHGANSKISRAAWSGDLSTFMVSGDHLGR